MREFAGSKWAAVEQGRRTRVMQLSVTAMRLAGLGQQAKSRVLIEEGRTHDQRIAEQSNKRAHRSEEHTSELQSHSDLVCRLLLEKKKKKNKKNIKKKNT